jgi:hypothetical protein
MRALVVSLMLLFLFVFGLGALFYDIVENDRKKEAAFMKECMDYGKPHFECQAMYQSTQDHSYPVVIPMVVPSGR